MLAAIIILPMAILLEGPFGKNLRAVASNENAARAFGIDVRHHLIAAFVWSSAVIAFAGAISAPRFRIIDPDSYGILTSIFTLAYPIIGGMGSIWGGLVGGGVLRIVPELLRPLADYIELMFCVLVVATLTFFPNGIGSAVRQRLRRSSRRKRRPMPTHGHSGCAGRRAAVGDRNGRRHVCASAGLRCADPPDRGRSPNPTAPCARSTGYRFPCPPRSLHGLMGPNGAGKTTLFNIVSGFIPADAGRVLLAGAPLDTVPIERRIGARHDPHLPTCGGVPASFLPRQCDHRARAEWRLAGDDPQRRQPRSTFGRHACRAAGGARGSGSSRTRRASRDEAGSLSLGDQRRLELARAIVSRPQLILLDEPVSGVAVEEAHRLRELLLAINRELGIAMVVIEHNIGFLVVALPDISVMSEGRIIAEGNAVDVVGDPRVRDAYFGEQEAAE